MIDFNLLKESLLKIPGLVEGFESIADDISNAIARYQPSGHHDDIKVHTLADISPRSSPTMSRSGLSAEHRAADAKSPTSSSGHRRSVSFASEAAMDEKTLALAFYAMGFKAKVEQEKRRAHERQIAAEPTHMTIQMARDGEEHQAGCCCFVS